MAAREVVSTRPALSDTPKSEAGRYHAMMVATGEVYLDALEAATARTVRAAMRECVREVRRGR